MKKILFSLAIILVLEASAYAEECTGLETNSQWMDGLQYVKNAVETKSWDSALERSRSIIQLCPNSPMLNYYISLALDGKGDKIKALQYIQKASDNTFVMATPPEPARRIWYARHDAEFPERTERALTELAHDNTTKTNELADTKQALHDDHAIGLWTGVGIGAAGLALIATGVTLALWKDQHYKVKETGTLIFNEESEPHFKTTTIYDEEPTYIWGVSLLSVGAAFVVSGTILSAIFGYKYSRSKQHIDYAVAITPKQFTFSLSF